MLAIPKVLDWPVRALYLRFKAHRLSYRVMQSGYYRSACSAAAAWYLRRIAAMSTWGFGSFRSISFMVSAMIWEMARLRNHLWLDGMTYHGACFVLVRSIASSNAAT